MERNVTTRALPDRVLHPVSCNTRTYEVVARMQLVQATSSKIIKEPRMEVTHEMADTETMMRTIYAPSQVLVISDC